MCLYCFIVNCSFEVRLKKKNTCTAAHYIWQLSIKGEDRSQVLSVFTEDQGIRSLHLILMDSLLQFNWGGEKEIYMALLIVLLLNCSRHDYLFRDSRFSALQNFKVFAVTTLVKRSQLSMDWWQNTKVEEPFLLKLCKKNKSPTFSMLLSQTLRSCLATCMRLPKRTEMSSPILILFLERDEKEWQTKESALNSRLKLQLAIPNSFGSAYCIADKIVSKTHQIYSNWNCHKLLLFERLYRTPFRLCLFQIRNL